ncbi:MAG TPA: 30S ribosomal protein S3 [archaeon]|nr:30S ribosomal protein S3 [archaeon]
MSSVKHFIEEAIKKTEIDEFLSKELERAGYGGVDIAKTPMGTHITIYAMKPGLVIGRRGQSIKDLSKILEEKYGLPSPQIAVAEVEVPELNAYIMATRIVSALQRGVHFRRAGFWALTRILAAGASGAEVVIRGKLTTERARYEKYRGGYLPKSGDPALKFLKEAVVHVKLKQGLLGVKVTLLPPNAEFPDKISMKTPKVESEQLPEKTAEEGTVSVPEEKIEGEE